MHEALHDIRVQYRWQAMDEENKAMKKTVVAWSGSNADMVKGLFRQ